MKFKQAIAVAILTVPLFSQADAQTSTPAGPALSFGVITQRSAVLTAQYWNPILHYVSARSGIPLQIKLAKTGPDHADMIHRGGFDFIYSNHNFTPDNEMVGYMVFARPIEAAIRGQIIVLSSSSIHSMNELEGKEVVFPSTVAFVGYHVPMDALLHAGIHVKTQFAGTQEGAMGQLLSGRAAAVGVNSQIAQDFASRQNIAYRVLWSSEEYLNIPISAHPSVPPAKVRAVRDALLHMAEDPEGIRILQASAALIQQKPPLGFVAASDTDFTNTRRFYKNSLVGLTR